MYRMKQNAVGLANICILSTGVLLVLSTTVSIYSGVLDIIHTRYPWEISIHGENQTKENCMEMEKTVKEVSEVTGLAVEQEQAYESLAVMLIQKDQELVPYQEGASMNPMGVSCDGSICFAGRYVSCQRETGRFSCERSLRRSSFRFLLYSREQRAK